MELRTLTYVEAIARLGSFTAAARELHVAQPAVSAQIGSAERELGVALFVRTPHGAVLTEAGRVVVARTRRMQTEMRGLRADIDDLNGLMCGDLRIGATPLLGPIDLTDIVRRFHARHPRVTLHIRTALITSLIGELDRGQLDVVVGPVELPAGSRLEGHVLRDESVVLIAPRELAPAPTRLADVRAEPFVCLAQGSGLRRILEHACKAAGYEPRVTIEVGSPQQIRDYVAAGLGVGLIAASLAAGPGASVQIVQLTPPPRHPPLGIITATDPSPAARAMLDIARA